MSDNAQPIVAGVDGIKDAWVVARIEGEKIHLERAQTVEDVADLTRNCVKIGIDMPIGLLDMAQSGGRRCEQLSRKYLGRRSSSVFSAPVRAALEADTYESASTFNRKSSADNIGLSKQTYHLFPKLRQIDGFMTPERQKRFIEVHPEVIFENIRQTDGKEFGIERLASKSTKDGIAQRKDLLCAVGFSELDGLIAAGRPLKAKSDDVLDACAAAWTAMRAASGDASRFPEHPPGDARGLRMEIWY